MSADSPDAFSAQARDRLAALRNRLRADHRDLAELPPADPAWKNLLEQAIAAAEELDRLLPPQPPISPGPS